MCLLEQAALVDQAQISTLHSFCATTLRLWFHQCNLDPAFTILPGPARNLLYAGRLFVGVLMFLASAEWLLAASQLLRQPASSPPPLPEPAA